MTTDPLVLLGEVDRATTRLLTTAATLDGDPTAPSLLPGWSRGHVLTHVARNADGLANLLTWAHTGVVTPQYANREQRDKEINAGANRPWDALLADIRESADRFMRTAEALSPEAWTLHLDTPPGHRSEVAIIPWRRLREVEVHHVDLGLGYEPTQWPSALVDAWLPRVLTKLPARTDPAQLLAWALRRGDAPDLSSGG